MSQLRASRCPDPRGVANGLQTEGAVMGRRVGCAMLLLLVISLIVLPLFLLFLHGFIGWR